MADTGKIIGGMLFFILAFLMFLVFLNAPAFISENQMFSLLFAMFPMIFGILGVIVLVK